ncbi:hypothetical protein IWW36_000825 [Coemansia brasiliensis]|uniref:Uncharacterized protein n=1 Tax=Coemansia brasiliensis TaxID=2650707 RepID=A0A9W8IJ22_9FUNG|nr:hypothetical protein IWW36_000825 [Coemansia brasiliensis]
MNGSGPSRHFGLFARPDFIAGVDSFREHFGQEVRSKTAEGYTFLGKDKHAPPHSSRAAHARTGPAAAAAAPGRNQAAHAASPSYSNTSPGSHPTGTAGSQRGLGAMGVQRATGTATTSTVSHRQNESTLDNLLSFIKPSPQSAPNTARSGGPVNTAAGSAAAKTAEATPGTGFRKTVVVSQAQSRIDALSPSLPAHHSLELPSIKHLMLLRSGISALSALAEQRKQTTRSAAHENAHKRHANDSHSRSRKYEDKAVEEESRDSTKKRTREAGFVFQLRVPKKVRRSVIDAIATAAPARRQALASANADRIGVKRARKQPATTAAHNHPGSSPVSVPASPEPATMRSRSKGRSKSRQRPQASDGDENTPYRSASIVEGSSCLANPSMSPAEIEKLRRQSTRLESMMRKHKHSGDAERESGGQPELQIGHYLESLACCLEDFWCRRMWQSLAEVHKNWSTMLSICKYLQKRCSTPELAPQLGCAAMITASVYYQLASTALAVVRQSSNIEHVARAAEDAARHLADMERVEKSTGTLLSAHYLARQFPRTWQRCQESAVSLGEYELRSHSLTKRWPPVAYPVGATTNPLDVANLVRQLNHEWLGRSALSLQTPNG